MCAFVLQKRTYWLVKRMFSRGKTYGFVVRNHTFW